MESEATPDAYNAPDKSDWSTPRNISEEGQRRETSEEGQRKETSEEGQKKETPEANKGQSKKEQPVLPYHELRPFAPSEDGFWFYTQADDGSLITRFTIQYREDVVSGLLTVRFSRPGLKKYYDFSVAGLQLRDIQELQYSGFSINNAAQMVSLVKEHYAEIKSVRYASSVCFNMEKATFYCFDNVIGHDDHLDDELASAWRKCVNSKEYCKILACSLMGMGAKFLQELDCLYEGETIVPTVCVYGKELDIDLLKTVILSPFGNPHKGFRDVYSSNKQNSKLDVDNEIMPIICNKFTYHFPNTHRISDDGYFFDKIGQFYSPLFVISQKKDNRSTNTIDVQIDDFVSLFTDPIEKESDEQKAQRKLKQYEEITWIKKTLVKHSGQLSCFIARELFNRKDYFVEQFTYELQKSMKKNNYLMENERRCKITALYITLVDIISAMFETVFDSEYKGDLFTNTLEERAYVIYDKILRFFIAAKEAGKIKKRADFDEGGMAFIETSKKKDSDEEGIYLYIKHDAFKESINEDDHFLFDVLNFWIESDIDNSPKGEDNYLQKLTVKGVRRRFYRFCMSDFENKIYNRKKNEA